MEEELSDSNSVFRIYPHIFWRNYHRYKENDEKNKLVGRLVHPNVVHVFLENDYEEKRYNKPWRLHRRHLSMESHIDSLVNIWRDKTSLEKLPDNITAMLQLAQGLEYIHSQKWIHGDIKPENVLIFENYSRKAITLKWAYYGLCSPLSEEQKKFNTKEELDIPDPKDGTQKITKFLEKQEPETNIEKETEDTGELSTKQDFFGKLSHEAISVEQRKKSENKMTINRKLSIIEKRKIAEKYYESTKERTWLAPELQGVSNPLSLATFQSDVFAEGLVFGWLLLDGAHPLGDQDKEITSNMIKNKPVNFEKKNSKRVLELIKRMLTQKAEERITSSEVVDGIKSIQYEMLEIPVLIEELGKNDALTWYCRYFNQKENVIENIQLLIKNGINVQSVDKEGNNALQILAQHYENANLTEIIQLLIENGIDVNYKNRYEDNALHLLCENYKNANLTEIIQLLIENGIDVNYKNRYEDNALHLLCENYKNENLIDIIRLLTDEKGIDVNCKKTNGYNVLHLLCQDYKNENLIDIIRLLIEKGIEVNCKTKYENNALHLLCVHYKHENLIEIIRLLIEKKIDVNCKNKGGDYALHFLCRNYENENLIDIIRLLIEKGIDVNSKNSRLENVIDAMKNCTTNDVLKDEIVKLLIRHGIQISNENYEILQKSGIEDRNGGLEILKYIAKEDLTLGWHKNCNSCENILSIKESARRKVQHHQMFGNTYVAFHMMQKDLLAWGKSTLISADADQDDPNTTEKLLEKAQNHFTDPEDKKCFETMFKISEHIMKGEDSSLFQCNLYEHYMRSLHRVAGVIGAKISQKQIEFFYLLPFDNPLSYPIDKMNDTEFKIALGEWDKTLFSWMHKPGDDYFGKTLKKDSKKGLFSQVNCSLNCHGKETEKM